MSKLHAVSLYLIRCSEGVNRGQVDLLVGVVLEIVHLPLDLAVVYWVVVFCKLVPLLNDADNVAGLGNYTHRGAYGWARGWVRGWARGWAHEWACTWINNIASKVNTWTRP